jgi:integrase
MVRAMGESTAREYESRLKNFSKYVLDEYHFGVDCLVNDLASGGKEKRELNPYDVLSGYASYLLGTLSSNTIKQRVVTAKNFLEYYDVEISPRKYKIKVRLPKSVSKHESMNKHAFSKAQIIEILNACSDIRLKTYLMLLAATGMRASEALSIRVCDLNLDSNPPRVFLRGEYTKTKADRTVFLTTEVANQLRRNWLEYKYRTRRVTYYDNAMGKSVTDEKTPVRNQKDLVFSMSISIPKKKAEYQYSSIKSIKHLYNDMIEMFGQTLDRLGLGGKREDLPGASRREIHLHLFRAFVKSTISDLGHAEFGEYHIGHKGSVYYRKSEKEKIEIFRKIESYLTFLDYEDLERRGSDIASRLEEKDIIIQNMMRKQEKFEKLIQSLIDSGQLKPSISNTV